MARASERDRQRFLGSVVATHGPDRLALDDLAREENLEAALQRERLQPGDRFLRVEVVLPGELALRNGVRPGLSGYPT